MAMLFASTEILCQGLPFLNPRAGRPQHKNGQNSLCEKAVRQFLGLARLKF
jgi:hypothetical protein